jgi:hypothetical protein
MVVGVFPIHVDILIAIDFQLVADQVSSARSQLAVLQHHPPMGAPPCKAMPLAEAAAMPKRQARSAGGCARITPNPAPAPRGQASCMLGELAPALSQWSQGINCHESISLQERDGTRSQPVVCLSCRRACSVILRRQLSHRSKGSPSCRWNPPCSAQVSVQCWSHPSFVQMQEAACSIHMPHAASQGWCLEQQRPWTASNARSAGAGIREPVASRPAACACWRRQQLGSRHDVPPATKQQPQRTPVHQPVHSTRAERAASRTTATHSVMDPGHETHSRSRTRNAGRMATAEAPPITHAPRPPERGLHIPLDAA